MVVVEEKRETAVVWVDVFVEVVAW